MNIFSIGNDPLYNEIDNVHVDPNTKETLYLHILSSIVNDEPLYKADTPLQSDK